MARKSQPMMKMAGVAKSVSTKVTPRLSAPISGSRKAKGSGNNASQIKSNSAGKTGGMMC